MIGKMKTKQLKAISVLLSIIALYITIIGCKSQNKHNHPIQVQTATQATTIKNKNIEAYNDNNHTFDHYDDYDEECDIPISDPLEKWNRIWFHFNDFLYMRIAKPVYTGYKAITPKALRIGVNNFFNNIQTPIRVINSLLQGKAGQAWVEFGRFIINSTVGLGGFINVAKKDKPRIPVDIQTADFGHTLSIWGFGEGFFIIWPVLGPSTVRDTFGMAGDIAMGPFFWLVEPIGIVPTLDSASSSIAFISKEYGITGDLYLNFNDLDSVLIPYESITKSAIEPYIALRDAYVKFRRDKKKICKIQP